MAEINAIDLQGWLQLGTISPDEVQKASGLATTLIGGCSLVAAPDEGAKVAATTLTTAVTGWKESLAAKRLAIHAGTQNRQTLMAKLAALIAEVTQLEYAFAVRARLSNLEQALFLSQMVDWWTGALPQFGPIPRQITEASKKAYEHLIVTDFELRFGNEYLALAEKKIEDFGVALASKGVDGTVTLAPTIGGKPIESILSEGELRLHALALFFAEVETSGHSVVVFDDPVSSFDFNYITNFCERLRELASSHPAKQILVLTHNWEFFVQVQLTMNQGGLDGQLAVFVLEGCQLVRSYSEELRDLKDQIDSILTLQREPTASEKCDLAGLMRRLIEAVVNEHVFVNQRSNFKQKTQQISAFDKFTKVKPLLPAEATELKSLWGKLSVPVHAGQRNLYADADKAVFKTRFERICAIETAIAARA